MSNIPSGVGDAASALLDLAGQLPEGSVRFPDGTIKLQDGRILRQDDLNRVQRETKNMASHNIQPSQPTVVPAASTASEFNQLLAAMSDLLRQNAFLVERVNANQATPNNHYSVLPDLSHNIEKFDGLCGASTARAWIKQLESTATMHRWTEAVAFETARGNLAKAAKNWYLANMDEIKDWKGFRKAFANTFMMEKSLTEKFEEMQRRCQGPDEATKEYFFDKVRLCKALNFELDEIKKQIAIGLWSREVSTAILSRSHFDIDDVLRSILDLESLEAARKQRIGAKKEKSKIQEGQRRLSPMRESRSSTQPKSPSTTFRTNQRVTEEDKTLRTRECFRCKEKGHTVKECKVRPVIKCFNCQEVAHISVNCPKPRKLPKGENYTTIDQKNKSDLHSKYEKRIEVGGNELLALIDPGSSDCLIRESVVQKFKYAVTELTNEIEGFGGGIAISKGVICENVSVDDCKVERVRFRVVPDEAQRYDVIVGRNYTEAPELAYCRYDDKLEFVYRKDFPFQTFPEVESMKMYASSPVVSKSICLPPASINFISVKIDQAETFLPFGNRDNKNLNLKKGVVLDTTVCFRDDVTELEQRKKALSEDDLSPNLPLNGIQKTQLLELLNRFRRCVALDLSELGCTNIIKMDIKLKPGAEPPYAKPYPTNAVKREEIKARVAEWKANKVVTETTSPYASPCILLEKPDGSKRLVVDYRRLNKITVRMHFPLPSIDDGLEALHGATIFAVLDLAQGYLQIPLTEEAKEKTAFITQDETGQFERAIFGLMNAPFYFAKLMKIVFGPYGNKLALTYFDDILVHARDWDELMGKLEQILIMLKEAGLTLNLKKCKFGLNQVDYLGYSFGNSGVKPGQKKVRAVLEFPAPKNSHEARSFHGLASFFRRFIPGFARKVAPIVEVFSSKVAFEWNERRDKAFREIKDLIGSYPIIAYYDPKAKFSELHTDACAAGLGAMLLQGEDRNRLRLVYAISRRTSEVERNYHSTKLELMAIVWAMERLRPFLIGIHFSVITDCQALVHIDSVKTKNSQIVRWLNTISDYDFDIHHRAGDKMRHVDALSRAPVEPASEELEKAWIFNTMISENEILMYQRSDELLAKKINTLKKEERKRSRRERGEIEGYVLRDGILYKISPDNANKELYVVPRAMRKALVIKNHDLASHFGVDRTIARIRENYYFPNMRNYVRRHIAACIECLFVKHKAGKQAGELHPIPTGNRPFEVVHLDHLGPFITSARGNKYILAAVCNFTKFCQLYAVTNTKASTTVKKVEKFVDHFGAPKRFITDRGTSFTSDAFERFCKLQGIKHTLNSSRHAQANGQVERLNQTILPAIQVN